MADATTEALRALVTKWRNWANTDSDERAIEIAKGCAHDLERAIERIGLPGAEYRRGFADGRAWPPAGFVHDESCPWIAGDATCYCAALASQPPANAVTDAQCDAIVRALDKWARNRHGSFEFGLPTWDDECFVLMRHEMRAAMHASQKEGENRG